MIGILIATLLIFGMGFWLGYFIGWKNGYGEDFKRRRKEILNMLSDGLSILKQDNVSGLGATIDPTKFFNIKEDK